MNLKFKLFYCFTDLELQFQAILGHVYVSKKP